MPKVSQVRPLGDRVLVKRLEFQHPILAVIGIKLEKGIVIAHGPGRRLRRKIRFDKHVGHLSSQGSLYFEDGEETGKVRPSRVKVGDIVEFSPRNQIDDEYDGEKYVWIKEQAIMWKCPDHKPGSGIIGLQSAGYDRNGNFLPSHGIGSGELPSTVK